MGFFNAIAFCPRCGGDVWVRCPSPRHLLHLKISLLTLGIWIVPWLLLTLLSGPCRCARCGTLAQGKVVGGPVADFAHPWREERFAPRQKRIPRVDFNTILVQKGLVFYASTRPIRA
ncbi:MAG: hypothetical protein ACOC98_05790 [Thermodesulfobacteriota bacterium]